MINLSKYLHEESKVNSRNLLLMFVHANLGRDFHNKFRALETLSLKQSSFPLSFFIVISVSTELNPFLEAVALTETAILFLYQVMFPV